MLGRAARTVTRARAAGRVEAPSALAAGTGAPARGMAVSLQSLKKRIRATGNVAKLTSVMKLVASAKLRSVEDALKAAKPFGLSLMDSIGQKEKLEDVEDLGARDETLTAEAPKNVERLVVVLSTDRGLCGAVNSSLARVVRSYLGERMRMGEEVKLFMLGEKARVQIGRDYGRIAVGAIDSAFDKDPIFPLAASIGEQILQQPFDELTLFYNHFENTAKFNNAVCNIEQLGKLKAGEMPKQFEGYDVEPDNVEETMLNLMEYSVAGTVYYTMLESQACEVSQRVAAMDNATNNAKDMVDRFTLQYNRARQAKITTELTEIISGAESLNEE